MLRTTTQRKKICAHCPVARVADLVGDSCSLLIMRDLLAGPKRFRELEQSLAGISSRTLTNKLKLLETQQLIVHRRAAAPRYELTKKGAAFRDVLDAMRRYGKKYL